MEWLVRRAASPVYTSGRDWSYKRPVYQSVEDETETGLSAETGRSLPWLGLGAIALLLAALAVWQLRLGAGSTGTSGPVEPEPLARAAYLQALGEADPALRRARLTDYLAQHPGTPRDGSVRAQLGVLDAAADRDWQATLTTAYDPRIDLESRRAAVEAYQRKWGRYLGARDEEVAELREAVERIKTLDALPDRTLPIDPERYQGVPDDRLAGDDRGRDPRIRFRPSFESWPDAAEPRGDVRGVRVRREATPRYPRRAERRGVEGVVTLALTVDEDGDVSTVQLIGVEADRYAEDFVRAAERAALRTRFEPRTVGGVPVETRGIRKTYRFELGN